MDDQQPASQGIYRKRFAVPRTAIDVNGHVNNVTWVQWMQDLAVEHWNHVGGVEVNRQFSATWVARSHHIEYLSPGYEGDPVEAMTWVANIGRVRSLRKYAFRRESDGKLLARGETDWVFVAADNGHPRGIPRDIHGILPVSADPV